MRLFTRKTKRNNHMIQQHGTNNRIIVVEFGFERELRHDEIIPGLHIVITGNNNLVKIHKPIVANNSHIIMRNNDAYVEIYPCPCFSNVVINCANGNAQRCVIGHGTTFYGTRIELPGICQLSVGTDCMFAHNTQIWAGDGHTVLDCNSGDVLNGSDVPVIIGNHVWLGEGARILYL